MKSVFLRRTSVFLMALVLTLGSSISAFAAESSVPVVEASNEGVEVAATLPQEASGVIQPVNLSGTVYLHIHRGFSTSLTFTTQSTSSSGMVQFFVRDQKNNILWVENAILGPTDTGTYSIPALAPGGNYTVQCVATGVTSSVNVTVRFN